MLQFRNWVLGPYEIKKTKDSGDRATEWLIQQQGDLVVASVGDNEIKVFAGAARLEHL